MCTGWIRSCRANKSAWVSLENGVYVQKVCPRNSILKFSEVDKDRHWAGSVSQQKPEGGLERFPALRCSVLSAQHVHPAVGTVPCRQTPAVVVVSPSARQRSRLK